MEKVLHKQLLQYLLNQNLLSENQDGFRPGHSTIDSIEKLTNYIYTALNKQYCTTAIFLDFKKAFDTLNHKILATKLTNIGLDLSAVNLIENYLKNRNQRTKANGILSNPHHISCGVPQGSVLGPLLFLVYINDMSKVLKVLECQHYADDTVVYLSHKPDVNVNKKINKDLNHTKEWCIRNKLSLDSVGAGY